MLCVINIFKMWFKVNLQLPVLQLPESLRSAVNRIRDYIISTFIRSVRALSSCQRAIITHRLVQPIVHVPFRAYTRDNKHVRAFNPNYDIILHLLHIIEIP